MIHLIFDVETCGLPKNWSAPLSDGDNWPRLVQLSFIISDGKDNREFDFIIKPEGFEIPDEAAAIHGITTERALKEGVELGFALGILRAMVNVADTIVAHNISFDKAIVGAEYHRLGIGEAFETRLATKKQFCTMKESTAMVGLAGTHGGGNKWPKLIELYRHLFNEDFSDAHNSLADTRACARCYFKLLENK